MFILSIDQGTTGTTAVLIDAKSFKLIDKVNQEYKQIYPQPGWVEHDLNDIWESVESTVSKILQKNSIDPSKIKTIGITNQRETTCPFDIEGNPLANAIVWQDRRTSSFCEELKSKKFEKLFKLKAGLPLDPYFSGTKINWLLNNNKQVKEAAESNKLRIGTIDTFLLYKLTNGQSFKTDVSNASRTLLMNLDTLEWDHELLEILGVSKNYLPKICDSIGEFGKTQGLNFLPDGIPVTGILGDQQAALFGQACFESGSGKCTYGTGAFMLVNTGHEKRYSDNGLLTTVAFKYEDTISYALEGSCYIAGACVQWLRDNLKLFPNSPDVENEALKLKDLNKTKDVLLLPFFTGIGSPYWKANAKAALIGLTRDTGSPEISRAALEGIALSINDLIDAMEADFGEGISELKVDGGAVANNLLMKIQAQISQINIIRPEIIETTAYGAGLAAAIGVGMTTLEQVKELWNEDNIFKSSTSDSEYYLHKKEIWKNYILKNY